MFFPLLFAAGGLLVWAAIVKGPRTAVAWAWCLGLLLPEWMSRYFGPVEFDLRTSLMLVALACAVFALPVGTPRRLVATDWVMAVLVVVLAASQTAALGWRPTVFVGIGFVWVLPYVAGRFAFSAADDNRQLVAAAALACLILSVYSACESLARANPVVELAGSYDPGGGVEGYRWGLRRATGPVDHPIFFGMLLVLLLPWALEAARRARAGEGPWWWKPLPWLNGVGVLGTLSRGPLLAAGATLVTAAFFYRPQWRLALAAMVLAAAATALTARAVVVDLLEIGVDDVPTVQSTIVVNGQMFQYTGTRHRLLLFEVYRDSMAHAGWLGYGVREENDFPHVEDHLRGLFASVDNHYMFTLLSAGYLGLAALLALGVAGVGHLLSHAVRGKPSEVLLEAAMLGALGGELVLLLTVWFSPTFGFGLLFSVGLAGSWRAAQTASEPRVTCACASRRLVRGHADASAA